MLVSVQMVYSTVNDDETEREEPVWVCKNPSCNFETKHAPTQRGTLRVLVKDQDEDVRQMTYASKDVVSLITQRDVTIWGEVGSAQRAAVRAALDGWCHKACNMSIAFCNGKYYLNGLHELQSGGPAAKRTKTS